MKALEKAAEDRNKTPAEAQTAADELTLEALDTRPGTRSGYPPARTRTVAGEDATRSSAQMQATAVLSARQPTSASPVMWMRTHPLYVFGGLAGWFLLLYAIYVYVQIAHPGWLTRSPPPVIAAAPPTPSAAMQGATPRNVNESTPVPVTQADNVPLVPAPSVFGNPGMQRPAAPAPDTGKEKDAAGTTAPPPAASTGKPPPAAATAAASTPAAPERPAAPPNRIAVRGGDNAVARVNPTVSSAYAALEAGQFDTAQRLYSQVLKSEPANVDALLGLAAIAQKDNRLEDAQRHFMTILEADPRHALAQAGLLSLMGRADPQAAESRLKQLLAREPSAPLYFNLGNLYADQGQWAQAQQAYFQAHSLEPANPDYAYNLAVGLEHLGQQKLALGFYRKALQLGAARGNTHFDTARLQDRITQLSARFE